MLVNCRIGRLLVACSLVVAGCSSVSVDDEAKDFVKECEAFRKDMKDAKDDAGKKKAYADHKDALTQKAKAMHNTTKWIGMSEDTNKSLNDCRSSTRSMLESVDKKLASEYFDDIE